MWLARRDAAGWSLADEDALAAWLGASTAHKVAFIRLEAAWNASRRLKALGAGNPSGPGPRAGVEALARLRPTRRRSSCTSGRTADRANESSGERRGRIPPKARALGTLQPRCRPCSSQPRSEAFGFSGPEGSVYRTAVGGFEDVPMRDGSKVTLNTDTGIRCAPYAFRAARGLRARGSLLRSGTRCDAPLHRARRE